MITALWFNNSNLYKNKITHTKAKKNPTESASNTGNTYLYNYPARAYLANVSFKAITFPKESAKLHMEAKENIAKINSVLADILDTIPGKSYSRIKDIISITDKLQSKNFVDDLIGYTKVLDEPEDKYIQKIMQKIQEKHESGMINLKVIKNFSDTKTKPYISFDHIETLKKVFANSRVVNDDFNNGYTTAIIRFDVNNLPVELQIRGTQVEKLHNIEHLLYDIKKGKTILKHDDETNKSLDKVIKSYYNLSEEQLKDYDEYIKNYYRYYRALEDNIDIEKPDLPGNINNTLSIQNLEKLVV